MWPMRLCRRHENAAWIEGGRAQLDATWAARQAPSSALPAWRRSRGRRAVAIPPARRAAQTARRGTVLEVAPRMGP
jgi:hypothetical protein